MKLSQLGIFLTLKSKITAIIKIKNRNPILIKFGLIALYLN